MSGGYVPDPRIFRSATLRSAATENALADRASEMSGHLYDAIEEHAAELDETKEVGVRLVNFGQTVVFHLSALEWMDPFLICFSGVTEEGHPVKLIQHTSQISILLMTLPRRDPEQPKAPIGFGPFQRREEAGEETE